VGRKVSFTLPGEPKGKGRPRAIAALDANGEPYVRLITPADTRAEEDRVRAAFRRAHPDHKRFTGPVLLRFTAIFETPRSFNKALREAAARGTLYAIKKPDKDNIEKLIVDALNKIAFADDQQVMGGGIKRYGSPARIDISFECLGSADVPITPGQRRAERVRQPELPLAPRKPALPAPTNAQSVKPDLRSFDTKTRDLILQAMARDEAAKAARKK
jgi:Holliday junction resolvase RusA-like endonuclease